MATTVFKFEEGRLLVQEARLLESSYVGSGVPVRIGQVRRVEKVLSLDTDYTRYGVVAPLNEVRVSNNQIFVVMRRGDTGGVTSGTWTLQSGSAALGLVSGLTSGLAWLGEIASGKLMSGLITVTATVLGY